jgi:hypothetical protein
MKHVIDNPTLFANPPMLTGSPRSSLLPATLNLFLQFPIPLRVLSLTFLGQLTDRLQKSGGVEIALVCALRSGR